MTALSRFIYSDVLCAAYCSSVSVIQYGAAWVAALLLCFDLAVYFGSGISSTLLVFLSVKHKAESTCAVFTDSSKTSNEASGEKQWLKQANNERGFCLFVRRPQSDHAGPWWSVGHGRGDNFFKMTDGGFHSQMPLLFVLGVPRGSPSPCSSASFSDNLQTSQTSCILPTETPSLRHERVSGEVSLFSVEAMGNWCWREMCTRVQVLAVFEWKTLTCVTLYYFGSTLLQTPRTFSWVMNVSKV